MKRRLAAIFIVFVYLTSITWAEDTVLYDEMCQSDEPIASYIEMRKAEGLERLNRKIEESMASAAALSSDTPTNNVNQLALLQMADRLNAPAKNFEVRENVSTLTGALELNDVILKIPGKNGHDVTLAAMYNSTRSSEGTLIQWAYDDYGPNTYSKYPFYYYNDAGEKIQYYVEYNSETQLINELKNYQVEQETGRLYCLNNNGVKIYYDFDTPKIVESYPYNSDDFLYMFVNRPNFLYNWDINIPYIVEIENYPPQWDSSTSEGNQSGFFYTPEGNMLTIFKNNLTRGTLKEDSEYKLSYNTGDSSDLNIEGVTYKWKVEKNNGEVLYFGADGKVIAYDDKYGNRIRYIHSGDDVTIIDTYGKTITVDYEEDGCTFEYGDKIIEYDIYDETDISIDPNDLLQYDNTYYLKKTNENGDETIYTMHKKDMYGYDRASSYEVDNILYPTGLQTYYTYDGFEYQPLGAVKKKSMLSSRKDYIPTTESYVNKKTYDYRVDECGFVNGWAEVTEHFQEDESEVKTTYVYWPYYINNLLSDKVYLLIRKTAVFKEGLEIQTEYTYTDPKYPPSYIEEICDGDLTMTNTVERTYDEKFNLISEVYNGVSKEYTYDTSEGGFNMLLSQKIQRDENAYTLTEYSLTSDKKSVEREGL